MNDDCFQGKLRNCLKDLVTTTESIVLCLVFIYIYLSAYKMYSINST